MCQGRSKFFEIHPYEMFYYFEAAYIVPGSTVGCFPVDSLLLNTLECLYSDSDCLSMLLYYTRHYPDLYVDEI